MGAPFDIAYVVEYFWKLLPFIRISLIIVASSILVGLGVGFLVALPRLYRVPLLQRVSQLYASFFRGTPIIIQLFLIYYGLPELLKAVHIDVSKVSALYFVILAYGLHSGAYISEGIRAAVSAVDRGQVEAAYAVGMTGYQAFTRIVFPQALAISIPILANLVIATLKDTSLAFTLGVMELTGKSQTLPTMSRHLFESYIALAIIYFIISFFLEKLFYYTERRLLKHEAAIATAGKLPMGKKGLNRLLNAKVAWGKGGTGV
ncbi:amino acid ABC transporter permease [Paenibacillus sp. BC26]|uniref:amino acid ABC transporter permease n=1 Tax=Paenibacillus sp. BC26 TaxID=1881032 RepID=UPI0008EE1F6F|nr:amino acid ABC transporter permease [Paenibacillus sp. BC26]SFT16987.1 L-cystine transport system permease protein [Paenibacillus sp. BC26]